MDLIFWRHAEAEDGHDDLARRLTPKGVKQAQRMGEWLEARLPKNARMIVSPAARAQETASRLDRPAVTDRTIGPGAAPAAVLAASGWPDGKGTVVIVGHQPTLGCAVALALAGKASRWGVRKGAIWWIQSREGESVPRVLAVVSPDLL